MSDTMKVKIQKPYPNYHSARIKSPKLFVRIRALRTTKEGIMFYGGPLNSDPKGSSEVQSIRFPKKKFTVKQAKKWLKDHNFKYISFEPAKEEKMRKIKTEDVNIENVKTAKESELYSLRLRFQQLHTKFFKGHNNEQPYQDNRTSFFQKYAIVVKEMKKRGIPVPTKLIDRELFKRTLSSHQNKEVEEISRDLVVIKGDDDEERIVYGIVYSPDEVDSQGDFASAEDIRKAAHFYMANAQTVKVNHSGSRIAADLLESYIAPMDLAIEGRAVKKGTWLLAMRINDPGVWKAVKEGELTGFSMAGIATRTKS